MIPCLLCLAVLLWLVTIALQAFGLIVLSLWVMLVAIVVAGSALWLSLRL